MELETTKTMVFFIGIILGSLTIIVALVISILNKKISTSGLGALAIGTILLGITSWTSITIKLPGEIVVELEKKLEESEKIIANINEERVGLLNQIQSIEATIGQISTTAAAPEQIQNLRNSIINIKATSSSINRQMMTLDSINKIAKTDLEKFKKSGKIREKKPTIN